MLRPTSQAPSRGTLVAEEVVLVDPWLAIGIVVGIVLAFDQAMLWAERHGWVYWRHNKASRTSVGSAMLEVQSILEPDKEHVVEERARQRGDIQQAGDDDPLE